MIPIVLSYTRTGWYKTTTETEKYQNAASAWYPNIREHDLWWQSLPSSSLAPSWEPGPWPSAWSTDRIVCQPGKQNSEGGVRDAVFDCFLDIRRITIQQEP